MKLILEDMPIKEAVAEKARACGIIKSFSSGSYDEAQEIVYVWSNLEREFKEFNETLLPQLIGLNADNFCNLEQSIRENLERIFSLIQLPRSYKTFIYPIEEI